MSESKRTISYAGAACVAMVLAGFTHHITKPSPVAGFERVGEEFFVEFEDPTLAKSMSVSAFDEDTAVVQSFEVVQKSSGEWVIPSHHDYPADGEDRLAKTAASIIGIKRGALASRYEDDHEKLGVIDPDDEDGTKLTGRGQRITLKDKDDEVLADYIIGKKVEKPEGHYYVRVPGEKEVYISEFEVDLSTKFSDWIEDDLLKLNQSDLAQIRVDKYSIDEQQGTLVGKEASTLKKDGLDWKLDGLDEEKEELQTSEINTMVSTLDNLKIVGIRPKPEGINSDLTVTPEVQKNRLIFEALQSDLANRGFRVGPKTNADGTVGGGFRLYANEGELTAGTSQGIEYTLRFGEIFTGSQNEIESGLGTDADKADQDKDDSDDAEDDEKESDTQRSRYLFVSTAFNEAYLKDKPVKPVEPPAFDEDAEKPKTEDKDEDAEKKKDEAADQDPEAKEEANGDKAKEEQKDDKAAEAKKAYEAALKKYETDLKAYQTKVDDGKKNATELNDRFGRWYYVISADSFEKLRLSRDAMVKAREKEEPKDDAKTAAPATAAPTATDDAADKASTSPDTKEMPAADTAKKSDADQAADTADGDTPAKGGKPADTPKSETTAPKKDDAAGKKPETKTKSSGPPETTKPEPTSDAESPAKPQKADSKPADTEAKETAKPAEPKKKSD